MMPPLVAAASEAGPPRPVLSGRPYDLPGTSHRPDDSTTSVDGSAFERILIGEVPSAAPPPGTPGVPVAGRMPGIHEGPSGTATAIIRSNAPLSGQAPVGVDVPSPVADRNKDSLVTAEAQLSGITDRSPEIALVSDTPRRGQNVPIGVATGNTRTGATSPREINADVPASLSGQAPEGPEGRVLADRPLHDWGPPTATMGDTKHPATGSAEALRRTDGRAGAAPRATDIAPASRTAASPGPSSPSGQDVSESPAKAAASSEWTEAPRWDRSTTLPENSRQITARFLASVPPDALRTGKPGAEQLDQAPRSGPEVSGRPIQCHPSAKGRADLTMAAGTLPQPLAPTATAPAQQPGLRDGSLSVFLPDPAQTEGLTPNRSTESEGPADVLRPGSWGTARLPDQVRAEPGLPAKTPTAPTSDAGEATGERTPNLVGDDAVTLSKSQREAEDGRNSPGPTSGAPAQGPAAPSVAQPTQLPANPSVRAAGLHQAALKDAGPMPASGSADPALADTGTIDMALSEARPGEGRGTADPATTRADSLPRATAAQLADVARRVADGPVEVSLSPEELGRVRLSLHGNEAQMTVQIMAERPETLELLRRHIDLLAAELRQQGFADLTFSFSGGGAGGSGESAQSETGAGDPSAGKRPQHDTTANSQARHLDGRPNTLLPGTGLDLRL